MSAAPKLTPKEQTFRAQVGRALGSPVTDPEWELLVRDDYVDLWDEGANPSALADAVGAARDEWYWRHESAPMLPTGRVSAVSGQPRAELVSDRRAAVARLDPLVVTFRNEVLAGQVLPWTDVQGWVAKRAGTATRWTVTVTAEGAAEPDVQGVETRTLRYAAPGVPHVQATPTRAGGDLERLRALADTLASAYGWEPAQASVFVLTDLVPLVAPIRATVDLGTAQTVTLTIDPTETAESVARQYLAARRELVGNRRLRSMGEKAVCLARFYDEQPPGGMTTAWMDEWNQRYPEWRYTDRRRFRRDAKAAAERI